MKTWILCSDVLGNFLNNIRYVGSPMLKFMPSINKSDSADREGRGYFYIPLRSSLSKRVFYEVIGKADEVLDDAYIDFTYIMINCAYKDDNGRFKKFCLFADNVIYGLTPVILKELVMSLTPLINEFAKLKSNKMLEENNLLEVKLDSSDAIDEVMRAVDSELERGKIKAGNMGFSIEEDKQFYEELESACGKPIFDMLHR